MRTNSNTSWLAEKQESCQAERISVLGLGNILLSDDGVGVRAIELLQKHNLPANIEIIDGGTASLDALLLVKDVEKLVVVDAMRTGKEPGTIYKARINANDRDKLEQMFSRGSKISLHQIGLIDALAAAEKVNCLPKEFVIIGIEPGNMGCGLELTENVRRKIPEVVNTILKEIDNAVHTE